MKSVEAQVAPFSQFLCLSGATQRMIDVTKVDAAPLAESGIDNDEFDHRLWERVLMAGSCACSVRGGCMIYLNHKLKPARREYPDV